MQPIATDGSITIVSLQKNAEPIEMPFGMWAWIGPIRMIY